MLVARLLHNDVLALSGGDIVSSAGWERLHIQFLLPRLCPLFWIFFHPMVIIRCDTGTYAESRLILHLNFVSLYAVLALRYDTEVILYSDS